MQLLKDISARADKRADKRADNREATTEQNSAEIDMLDNGYDSFADLFIDFNGTIQKLRDGRVNSTTAIHSAEPINKYLEKAQAFIETFQFYAFCGSYTEADLGSNSRIPMLRFKVEAKSD